MKPFEYEIYTCLYVVIQFEIGFRTFWDIFFFKFGYIMILYRLLQSLRKGKRDFILANNYMDINK